MSWSQSTSTRDRVLVLEMVLACVDGGGPGAIHDLTEADDRRGANESVLVLLMDACGPLPGQPGVYSPEKRAAKVAVLREYLAALYS